MLQSMDNTKALESNAAQMNALVKAKKMMRPSTAGGNKK
jgi:hypothetical protein